MSGITRRAATALLAGIGLAAAVAPLRAQGVSDRIQVVMFRRAGCPWCHTWDREIGTVWDKTEIGAREPMIMVDLDRDPAPAIALARPARFTPTFVVARDGVEVARIEGYPGQDFFWGLIEKAIGDAEAEAAAAPVSQ